MILSLALEPHPEGGYFRELYRSPLAVGVDGRGSRSALTTIYFLLGAGDVSRWHRLTSDEVWHFYEGAPLELLQMDPALQRIEVHVLGVGGAQWKPVSIVPAGVWQAARSTGEYSLVGCTVGPGFEFADFEMLSGNAEAAALVRLKHPDRAGFV